MIKPITTNKGFLRVPCMPADESIHDIYMIVWDLMDTATASRTPAAGLAANQIGHRVRICLIREGDGSMLVMVNPVITKKYGGGGAASEGCLSMPGRSVRMYRYHKVNVTFQTQSGTTVERTFKGFRSRVVQHEVDHLDGKLMGDK